MTIVTPELFVCVKQALRVRSPPAFTPDRRDLAEQCRSWHTNEADRCALEAALAARERGWVRAVTCVSAGPPAAEQALRYGLAAGADRALLIPAAPGLLFDPAAAGTLLGAALRHLGARLVFTSQRSDDGRSGAVPAYLAHALGAAYLSEVWDLRLDAGRVEIRRRVEHGHRQIWQAPLPAVLAFAAGARAPRYVSVAALALARHIPIEQFRPQTFRAATVQASGAARLQRLAPARVRAKKTLAPSPTQSAAERMRALASGGSTAKRTRILEGATQETAAAVRDFLVDGQFLEGPVAQSGVGPPDPDSQARK